MESKEILSMAVMVEAPDLRPVGHSAVSAFACLGERNPLRLMTGVEQQLLFDNLRTFTNWRRGSALAEQFDQLSRVARDAAALANSIEHLLKKDYGDKLPKKYLSAHHDLPAQINAFANGLGGFVDGFGTTSVKRRRVERESLLICASEFVKNKTGTWNDEHLAELLQTMRSKFRDLSGDAIHKKRERYKRNHPGLYRACVTIAFLDSVLSADQN